MKVNYEGVSFDVEWATKKTLAEFMEHEKHHGLTKDQLKEAHALCKKTEKTEKSNDKANTVD